MCARMGGCFSNVSLGPVVNVLAIFSDAYILNKKNYNMCYML